MSESAKKLPISRRNFYEEEMQRDRRNFQALSMAVVTDRSMALSHLTRANQVMKEILQFSSCRRNHPVPSSLSAAAAARKSPPHLKIPSLPRIVVLASRHPVPSAFSVSWRHRRQFLIPRISKRCFTHPQEYRRPPLYPRRCLPHP